MNWKGIDMEGTRKDRLIPWETVWWLDNVFTMDIQNEVIWRPSNKQTNTHIKVLT